MSTNTEILWIHFQAPKPTKPSYVRKVQPPSQWYDVGIVKGISMMVTHYYLSTENTSNNEVSGAIHSWWHKHDFEQNEF